MPRFGGVSLQPHLRVCWTGTLTWCKKKPSGCWNLQQELVISLHTSVIRLAPLLCDFQGNLVIWSLSSTKSWPFLGSSAPLTDTSSQPTALTSPLQPSEDAKQIILCASAQSPLTAPENCTEQGQLQSCARGNAKSQENSIVRAP